jgi:hypothetical protein
MMFLEYAYWLRWPTISAIWAEGLNAVYNHRLERRPGLKIQSVTSHFTLQTTHFNIISLPTLLAKILKE